MGWRARSSNPGGGKKFLFSTPAQASAGAGLVSCEVHTADFPRGKSDGGLALTTHPNLPSTFRVPRDIPLRSLYAIVAYYRESFT
jgi:hypothetical protein